MADAQLDLADVYAHHRQGLFTHALAITGCAARAEDAVHDAFERLVRNSHSADRDAVAYVFAAVRSAALDQLRALRRGPAADLPASLFADIETGPATEAIRAEQERFIATAVNDLPAEQKEVIVLRIYAGLSFAQIAQVTAEPLQTIASRYRRTLEKLRQTLGKLA